MLSLFCAFSVDQNFKIRLAFIIADNASFYTADVDHAFSCAFECVFAYLDAVVNLRAIIRLKSGRPHQYSALSASIFYYVISESKLSYSARFIPIFCKIQS